MQTTDSEAVLDRAQLREVTMDDPDLMRQLLSILIEDTSAQLVRLSAAIREQDAAGCRRLAHYSKGACANVGARRAAELLEQIERNAQDGRFQECNWALEVLTGQMARLREEEV